jgi:hypothetical protein
MAFIQEFAIVAHGHPLPKCTSTKHSPSCRRRGIWLGCKTVGRMKRVWNPKEKRWEIIDDRSCICMHLRR